MKKISMILVVAMIFSTLISFTYADTTDTDVNPTDTGSNISISFKIGDETLKINGKEIKVVKPYAVDGNTLVPLRVITEAFGADVKWEPTDSSITVTYSEVSIKLFLNKKDAYINGQKTTIAAAPVAINGTTMVPLRFITENFGADVSYNEKTKEITVTKEIVSDNSIKDFSLLLKNSTKERVGDSYYKWSIKLPEGFEITSRSYAGDTNIFTTPSEDKFLYVLITDKEDETLEYIWQNEAMYLIKANMTILQNDIVTSNGTRFERVVYKDSEGVYERRYFILGDKIYVVGAGIYDNTVKNTNEYQACLDSFMLSFTDTAKTEDLSDVDKDGYRAFTSKELKFTFSVPADWSWIDYEKDNYISFFDNDTENMLSFSMYSKGTITGVDNWIQQKKQFMKDEYNADYVKITNEERTSINGMDAVTLTTSWKYNSEIFYNIDTYIVGKDYRYELSIGMEGNSYNQAAGKKMIDYIIKSLKISTPDADEVGALYDAAGVMTNTTLYAVNDPASRSSFKVPMNWQRESTENNILQYYYNDPTYSMSFVFASANGSFSEVVNKYESITTDATKSGEFKTVSKEVLNEKGATIYKYTNTYAKDDFALTEYYYIIDKGGKTYVVYFDIDNMRMTEKNMKLINDMWNAIVFN